MPVRQIRKNPKNHKHKSRKSHSRKSHSRNPMQKGGDVGRYVLPPAYFGNGTSGYYADGSSALNSCGKQHAVSQGVISANGKLAGPNLYPMMGGSSCNKKEFKSKTMKGGSCNKKTKSHKSKSRKH